MDTYGSLYTVALPIGDPRDITLRAIDILKSVDIIAAEDTRVFKKLASEHGIAPKKLVSHHDHNEKKSSPELVRFLEEGRSIALVSDAGTPNLSDPGFGLLSQCYDRGIRVIPVPGPSALSAALSVSPLPISGGFLFLGFAPNKSVERRGLFNKVSKLEFTLGFYEAPHRIIDHLKDAVKIFGSSRKTLVLRELTKKHEEVRFEELQSALEYFLNTEPRGEFVILYGPSPVQYLDESDLAEEALKLLQKGLHTKEIVSELRNSTSFNNSELYSFIESLKTR